MLIEPSPVQRRDLIVRFRDFLNDRNGSAHSPLSFILPTRVVLIQID